MYRNTEILKLILDDPTDPEEVAYATAFVKGYESPIVFKATIPLETLSKAFGHGIAPNFYGIRKNGLSAEIESLGKDNGDILILQDWEKEGTSKNYFISSRVVTEDDLPLIHQEIKEPNSTR